MLTWNVHKVRGILKTRPKIQSYNTIHEFNYIVVRINFHLIWIINERVIGIYAVLKNIY